MSAINRLAKLKLRKFKRVDDYKVVDMRSAMARLHIAIICGPKRRKHESDLSAFARAMRLSVPALWSCAYSKPDRFRARLLAVDPRADVDAVREEIIRQFVIEETTWQFLEAIDQAGGLPWKDGLVRVRGPVVGLCSVRPCRPAVAA
jgi:hypothetical protein